MIPVDLQETQDYLQSVIGDFKPEIGIILGTGLGSFAREISPLHTIPYHQIPHFPVSTVESHSGRLLLGTIAGKKVVCMEGRFHYYEGYSMKQVTYPVRVMAQLGIHTLLVSNASGGLNPDFQESDIMIIEDHISLFLPASPLTGKHYPAFGDRFPDMCDPYDLSLIAQARQIAAAHNIVVKTGVYVSVPGPQLETRAEYRFLRLAGADAVGMSTVPEIIAAHQAGIRCFGLSVITDMGLPETLKKSDFSHIIANAKKAEPSVTVIFKELIQMI
jgi:purine-nucleoside phosphorylase